uniref:Uncharacterized protein n=1 Tax=Nelumbo nucifera TaxID=4432 RepID=A0A822Z2H6_NELNU|nr:TPA_asm: hypothetical protein HUJ06_008542 [Nelumbo nucifera]
MSFCDRSAMTSFHCSSLAVEDDDSDYLGLFLVKDEKIDRKRPLGLAFGCLLEPLISIGTTEISHGRWAGICCRTPNGRLRRWSPSRFGTTVWRCCSWNDDGGVLGLPLYNCCRFADRRWLIKKKIR